MTTRAKHSLHFTDDPGERYDPPHSEVNSKSLPRKEGTPEAVASREVEMMTLGKIYFTRLPSFSSKKYRLCGLSLMPTWAPISDS